MLEHWQGGRFGKPGYVSAHMPGKWNRNVYFEVFHAWAWARSCSAVFCFVEDDGSADAEHTEQLCTCRVTKIQCITAQAQLSRPHGHEPNQPCLQCGGFVLTTFNTTGFCFSPSRFEGGAHHLPLLAIAQGCLVQMMTLSMSYKIMCSARRSPCIYAFPGRRPICCDPAFVAIVPLIRQQVRSCMASPPTLPCCRRHAHHSLLHALYCNAGNSMALNHTLRASFLGSLRSACPLKPLACTVLPSHDSNACVAPPGCRHHAHHDLWWLQAHDRLLQSEGPPGDQRHRGGQQGQ
eukprot:scaffold142611_cov19-Tisochrysis_lutea.AAC.1